MIGKIVVTKEMEELVVQYQESNRAQGYDRRTKEWKSFEAKKDQIQNELALLVKAQAIEQLNGVGLAFDVSGRYADDENKFYLYIRLYSSVWSNSYSPSYYIATNNSERSNSSIASNEQTAEEILAAVEKARAKQIEYNRVNSISDKNRELVFKEFNVVKDKYGYLPHEVDIDYDVKNKKENGTWYGRDAQVKVYCSGEKINCKLEAGFESKDPQEVIALVKEFQAFLASRYEVKVRE